MSEIQKSIRNWTYDEYYISKSWSNIKFYLLIFHEFQFSFLTMSSSLNSVRSYQRKLASQPEKKEMSSYSMKFSRVIPVKIQLILGTLARLMFPSFSQPAINHDFLDSDQNLDEILLHSRDYPSRWGRWDLHLAMIWRTTRFQSDENILIPLTQQCLKKVERGVER